MNTTPSPAARFPIPACDRARLHPTQVLLWETIATLADAHRGFDRVVAADRLGWKPSKVSSTIRAIIEKKILWPFHTISRAERGVPDPITEGEAWYRSDRVRVAWAHHIVALAAHHGLRWYDLVEIIDDENGQRHPDTTRQDLIDLTGLEPGPDRPVVAIRSEVDRLRLAWKSRDPDRLIRTVYTTAIFGPNEEAA